MASLFTSLGSLFDSFQKTYTIISTETEILDRISQERVTFDSLQPLVIKLLDGHEHVSDRLIAYRKGDGKIYVVFPSKGFEGSLKGLVLKTDKTVKERSFFSDLVKEVGFSKAMERGISTMEQFFLNEPEARKCFIHPSKKFHHQGHSLFISKEYLVLDEPFKNPFNAARTLIKGVMFAAKQHLLITEFGPEKVLVKDETRVKWGEFPGARLLEDVELDRWEAYQAELRAQISREELTVFCPLSLLHGNDVPWSLYIREFFAQIQQGQSFSYETYQDLRLNLPYIQTFQLGIALIALILGNEETFFPNLEQSKVILQCNYQRLRETLKIERYPEALADLLCAMLHPDKERRPHPEEVLKRFEKLEWVEVDDVQTPEESLSEDEDAPPRPDETSSINA